MLPFKRYVRQIELLRTLRFAGSSSSRSRMADDLPDAGTGALRFEVELWKSRAQHPAVAGDDQGAGLIRRAMIALGRRPDEAVLKDPRMRQTDSVRATPIFRGGCVGLGLRNTSRP